MDNVLLPFVYSRGKVYLLYFSHSLALSDHLISQWLEVPMMLLDDTLFLTAYFHPSEVSRESVASCPRYLPTIIPATSLGVAGITI